MISLPTSPAAFGKASWDEILPFYNDLLDAELDLDNVEAWLASWSALENLFEEARETAYFAYTCDTTDARKEEDNLRFQTELEPNAAEQRVRLAAKLVALGYSRDDLAETLRRFRRTISIFREANVPLKAEVERLSAEYQKVTGSMTAQWHGETLALPRLRPFVQDPDRSVREDAWRLQRAPYVAHRDELARIFSDQYRLRQEIATNAGFANFRDYMHAEKFRFDYSPDDCYRFHEAVAQKVVPAAARILERHRRKLGLDRLLPWDTLVDPDGRPSLRPFTDVNQFISGTVNIFKRVDPVLGGYFKTMQDENLLDLESRRGKAPGGYMTALPHRRRPLIFMNAVGVHDDLVTLVHEAGHSFHGFEEMEHQGLAFQRGPGMEMAEVGSMAMELLSAPYWGRDNGGFYSEEDYRRARVQHLEGIITFFPHCATVDAFQHWIYSSGEGHDPVARDSEWIRLRELFETGVDYSGLRSEWIARWYQQLHIFEVPFYYIEYGIAQLGALQVWRNARRDQAAAVSAYRRALALGSTRPLPELYAAANIELAFDGETIGELVQMVEEELGRLEA